MFRALALILMLAGAGIREPGAGNREADQILHVLNRLTYGPRPGDVERVKAIGVQNWIETQLTPSRIDDTAIAARLARLNTLNLDSETIQRDYAAPAMLERRNRKAAASQNADPDAMMKGPVPEAIKKDRQVLTDLEEAKLLRAVYSERQLEEVLVDFWFNHFNVFAGKGMTRNYVSTYERDAIRPYVLGHFRDMLGATAKSPAMLFYLDNWLSSAEGARGATAANRRSSGINENYARELLELHTLGVDGGYTQQDIVNVARAFTGWSMQPRQGSGFIFMAQRHDRGEKIVLGHTIPAGGGVDDGERVLDIVASHPATARHIAKQLAMRFVSDQPPAVLVDRLAAKFTATKGDLREVIKTLFASREFLSADSYRAKVKTPLEFVASALRAANAEIRVALPLARTLKEMGMPLYFCQPPTGYDETATTWVSAGALVSRMNFAVDLSKNAVRGVRVPLNEEQTLALKIGAPEFQRQ
jgi:uncharacterized protein (DUF1800 family)